MWILRKQAGTLARKKKLLIRNWILPQVTEACLQSPKALGGLLPSQNRIPEAGSRGWCSGYTRSSPCVPPLSALHLLGRATWVHTGRGLHLLGRRRFPTHPQPMSYWPELHLWTLPIQLGLKQNWQVVAALMPSPEMGKRPRHSMASWFYTGQVGPVTDANQGEKPWSLKKIKNQEGLYGFEKRN